MWKKNGKDGQSLEIKGGDEAEREGGIEGIKAGHTGREGGEGQRTERWRARGGDEKVLKEGQDSDKTVDKNTVHLWGKL